jgi:GT2 family glycosyltransferase
VSATIIIPQRGLSRLTLECLRSFQLFHGDATPVVVIDDGSPSDAAAVAGAGIARVEVLRRPAEGVTAAWNAGARASRGDTLVFLNNDTVTTRPWLERLLAPLSSQDVAISGLEGRVERAVPEAVLRRLPTRRFAGGWCFAVRRHDFDAIEGFEPELAMYFSDTDLQARLLARREDVDRVIAIVGGEGIRHLGHATATLDPARAAQWRADRDLFVELWSQGAFKAEWKDFTG